MTKSQSDIRVLINVYDGLIQDVACSHNAEVIIVDWDTKTVDSDACLEVPTTSGPERVLVYQYPANQLTDYIGTDVDLALQQFAACGGQDDA